MKVLKWTPIVAAAITYLCWVQTADAQPAPVATPLVSTRPVSSTGATAQPEAASSYLEAYKKATDYWDFAHAILPAAKAGDRDAQFILFDIQLGCAHDRSPAPLQDGKLLSLEQEVKKAAEHGISAKEASLFYHRCSQFFAGHANDLGPQRQWLERAAEAGQPVAQAYVATMRLGQEHLMVTRHTWDRDDLFAPPMIGGNADPHELLRVAIESADPAVIFQIAVSQNLLNPTKPRAENELNFAAWLSIACQRGADCAFYGEPVSLPCSAGSQDCGSVPKTLLAIAHNNWAPVADRARQISAALDARDWDQLNQFGLGATAQTSPPR